MLLFIVIGVIAIIVFVKLWEVIVPIIDLAKENIGATIVIIIVFFVFKTVVKYRNRRD